MVPPAVGADDDCPACGGTGWVSAAADDDPTAGVTRCDCFRRRRSRRRLEAAAIPPRYHHCSLENFHAYKGARGDLEGAKIRCRDYVEEFPRLDYGLLFTGTTGVGKTHLAVAVLRQLIERHAVRGLFTDYRDLLRDIQASYDPVSETSEIEVLRPVLEADVLLLDELGARRPTAWVQDTVTHILNDRYNGERTTLITTNFPVNEQQKRSEEEPLLEERIGERLRSRLYEMCRVVLIDGDDFREQIRQKDHYGDYTKEVPTGDSSTDAQSS